MKTTTEFNTGLGNAGCVSHKLATLLLAADEKYGADGKISGLEFLELAGDAALAILETSEECFGKKIEIEFGSGPLANLLELLIREVILKGKLPNAAKSA